MSFSSSSQFTLLLAFASIYVAFTEAGVVKRQAAVDKARRIVRIRGRQREDRQLFFEPLPLATAQPLLIPSAAPLSQPIQIVELRQQPQPVEQFVEVREEPIVEVKTAETNYEAPEAAEITEVIAVRDEEPVEATPARTGYGAPEVRATYDAPAATQIVEVRQPIFTVPQTIAAERIVPVKPIAITRRLI